MSRVLKPGALVALVSLVSLVVLYVAWSANGVLPRDGQADPNRSFVFLYILETNSHGLAGALTPGPGGAPIEFSPEERRLVVGSNWREMGGQVKGLVRWILHGDGDQMEPAGAAKTAEREATAIVAIHDIYCGFQFVEQRLYFSETTPATLDVAEPVVVRGVLYDAAGEPATYGSVFDNGDRPLSGAFEVTHIDAETGLVILGYVTETLERASGASVMPGEAYGRFFIDPLTGEGLGTKDQGELLPASDDERLDAWQQAVSRALAGGAKVTVTTVYNHGLWRAGDIEFEGSEAGG